MRQFIAALFAVFIGALLPEVIRAQTVTHVYTVTNVVTVLVTNVVTVTNVVVVTPPATSEAKPADMEKPPQYPWKSSLTAGLTLTQGNSHSLMYYGAIDSTKKTPDNEFSLGASGAYGSQDSEESVNTYGGYSQWNHLFTERFYDYIRLEARRDLVANVDYRITLGPGLGYYLVKNTNTTLSVESGAGIEFQRIGQKTTVGTNTVNSYDNEYFATARFAEKFEHKVNDHLRIWQSVELLPQVDEFDNYTLRFELGLETGFTKTMSLKTFVVDNFASQPADGRQKNDFRMVSALSYKF